MNSGNPTSTLVRNHLVVLSAPSWGPDLTRQVVENGKLRVSVQGSAECGSWLGLTQWDMQISTAPNSLWSPRWHAFFLCGILRP